MTDHRFLPNYTGLDPIFGSSIDYLVNIVLRNTLNMVFNSFGKGSISIVLGRNHHFTLIFNIFFVLAVGQENRTLVLHIILLFASTLSMSTG